MLIEVICFYSCMLVFLIHRLLISNFVLWFSHQIFWYFREFSSFFTLYNLDYIVSSCYILWNDFADSNFSLNSCIILRPFCVSSQEVVKAPAPIFMKFYSNCHSPTWWTSAKFEWNLSRNGMIIKLFRWGFLAREVQIVHIWPCLKPYYC